MTDVGATSGGLADTADGAKYGTIIVMGRYDPLFPCRRATG
jgi:hypothetical protein